MFTKCNFWVDVRIMVRRRLGEKDISNLRLRSVHLLTSSKALHLWCLKLQATIALSRTKAEFYSLSHCTKEIIWMRDLLKNLTLPLKIPR